MILRIDLEERSNVGREKKEHPQTGESNPFLTLIIFKEVLKGAILDWV